MKTRIGFALVLAVACWFPFSAGAGSPPAGAKHGPAASVAKVTKRLVEAAASRQLLVVGELHGTKEAPGLVAMLARQAAATRPVRLGLEMPSEMADALRTYLHSAGRAQDKAALVRQPFWSSRDGRSSRAMLDLIEAARVLRARGRDVDAFVMEPAYPDAAKVAKAGGYMQVKEAGMAAAIQRVLGKDAPQQLVIALMGNYHARDGSVAIFRGTPGNSVTERLAAFSPYVLLPLAKRSESWNCTAQGCGAHVYESSGAPSGRLPCLVTVQDGRGGTTVTELWLAQFTASPPARAP